jgi:hypothetical protein
MAMFTIDLAIDGAGYASSSNVNPNAQAVEAAAEDSERAYSSEPVDPMDADEASEPADTDIDSDSESEESEKDLED